MKSISAFFIVALSGMVLFSACSDNRSKSKTVATSTVQYTCPMHPQIIEDHPGSCPICGMKLVKKSGEASEGAGISLNTVLQPVNSTVISSVTAITPQQRRMPIEIHADGYLDFDTRTYNNIAARFSGRIEKLYVKYAFQEIRKGERIMDIYSPKMLTAQEDLIFLLKNSPNENGLIHAAKEKLLLLGMTNDQINEVVKNGKPFYSLPVYSPYDGHVHDMPHSQMSGVDEGNPSGGYTKNLPLAIKEGMYVEKGQTIFNVVDPHRLWAVIKIDPKDATALKLYQPVTISLPDQRGRTLDGRVDFIEPLLQTGDKTTSIRVYLHNMDHLLKVNSIVRATINEGETSGIWVPRSAVLDLGQTSIVWLKQGALYKAKQVTTGSIYGDNIQIKNGITVADSIAANAQYLADSESFIKTANHE